MPTAVKYILMQVPGALFVGVLLLVLHNWGWLSLSWGGGILALWVIKDALLYPFYRRALESGPETGAHALAGSIARTATPLDPRGLVTIQGERWRAESRDGRLISAGRAVRVYSVRGLLLHVERIAETEGEWDETGSD
jgi:membrane protein implicated in regulation of membrane protease activity